MIKVERSNLIPGQIADALRGMRNPLDSWDKADSEIITPLGGKDCLGLGERDVKLMKSLIAAGPDHRKFLRAIHWSGDITAPLFWWKEYDTYKIGTVANSCSTMHTITKKEFTIENFSTENLTKTRKAFMESNMIPMLESLRLKAAEGDKQAWRELIELLPSSFNQKRTVSISLEALRTMILSREKHKLKEWRDFAAFFRQYDFFNDIVLYVPEKKTYINIEEDKVVEKITMAVEKILESDDIAKKIALSELANKVSKSLKKEAKETLDTSTADDKVAISEEELLHLVETIQLLLKTKDSSSGVFTSITIG